jgi:hypothetical protein
MIITVLSTPRSGSTAYTQNIKYTSFGADSNVIILAELFTALNKNRYNVDSGNIKHLVYGWRPGAYYEDMEGDQIVKKYQCRKELDKNQEFNKCIDAMLKSSKNFIVHEHVHLLQEQWVDRLKSVSNSISYIKRNRKEQLSSFAIATYTGVFINDNGTLWCHGNISNMHEYKLEKFENPIIVSEVLSSLITFRDRVNLSNNIVATRNIPVVNYEEIIFSDQISTKKLSDSSFNRLCTIDQQLVLELC